MMKRGRPLGSKNREHSLRPHPLIMLHKQQYVHDLDGFVHAIFPKADVVTAETIINCIKEHKLKYRDVESLRKQLNINAGTYNSILRRLKDLGIMTKDYNFSEMFAKKLDAILYFYGTYTGKTSQLVGLLTYANEEIAKLWKEAHRVGTPTKFEPLFVPEEPEEKKQEEKKDEQTNQ